MPELFPDLQLIVTNSYGHTFDAPRFRVIILTSSTVGPAAYEALWDALANKLKDAGYAKSPKSTSRLKRSGLDHSKRAATSLFYLPAQAAEGTASFFKFYEGGLRRPLETEAWLRNVRLKASSEHKLGSDRLVNSTEMTAAIAQRRGSRPGKGNDAFYALALELARLGMTANEVEQILLQEAHCARSPAERKNQIPSIIRSLAKKRRVRMS